MRRTLLLLIPFVIVGCSQKTPEEAEAAKYDQPKMMSEEEGAKFMSSQSDPRKGGPIPPPPPGQASSGSR